MVQRCKEIGSQLDLPFVCSQFVSSCYYTGVVELSLTAAQARDPLNLALHYYNNKMPATDIQGSTAYALRSVLGPLIIA